MKTRKMTPRNVAPVKRENTATVSRDGNAIAPQQYPYPASIFLNDPFAGDEAE